MPPIVPLSSLNHAKQPLFGGKATALGELITLGIPVPPGFAIAASAAHESGPHLNQQLLEAFDALGAARVAVRSSAIAEDGPEASWAGQLETYLNVGRDDLIARVTDCWESINSLRAKSYATYHEATKADIAVGVVVQTMIDSEVSGIMFTANPVTGDKTTLIIEGAYGLGELIVSGGVTPDHWELSRDPLTVVTSVVSEKDSMIVFADGRNLEISVPKDKAAIPTLNSGQLLELAQLGLKIEAHFGRPQDIEWARNKGHFHLVQSRPITTLGR